MYICSFPTTVIFVDDNENYLKLLSETLSDIKIIRKNVKNIEVVKYIDKYIPPMDVANFAFTKKVENFGELSITNRIENLHKIIYKKDRFSMISVLVTDNVMPNITGEEILYKIRLSKIKKILLTGEVGVEKAIELLNNRIINKFITKQDKSFYEKIHNEINVLIQSFFYDKFAEYRNKIPFLKNTFLCNVINNLIETEKPTEYYVLDNNGSYLMLDSDANISRFLVQNKKQINYFINLFSKNGVSEDRYRPILNGTGIVNCMYNYHQNIEYCLNNIVEAKFITGASGEDLYYAFIRNDKSFDIDTNKIESFNKYISLNN